MPPLDPRIPSGIAPPPGMPTPVAGMPSAPAIPPGMADQVAAIQGAAVTPTEDGGAILQLEDEIPEEAERDPGDHGDNLAEQMEESDLSRLAQEVLEGIEADEQSNEPYFEAVRAGIELLGLKNEQADDPFEGASGAVHPMILIALVRFVANARGELQPADGPARCKIEATPEPAVAEIAARKEKWLNYYLTCVDRGYYRDCDAGWLHLGLYGSIFRKVYDCPHTGQPRSRYLTPLQLLVSWHASDLETADRATHIDTISTAEAIRRQLNGYYREGVDFQQVASEEDTPERRQREATDGRTPSDREEDAEQVHMHSHVLLDPAEWGLPNDGPDGLPIPYVVSVDRRTEKVLRIERDWREGDEQFLRRETYAHYLMHPGLGFYGWSFLILMGCTANTATTLWRQAINTFMLHTHPGGLRAKGMRPDSENLTVGPGEFAEVDTGGLPIDQAIMPLPYRDIPPSFAPLFETVVNAGQTLGGTQELQVGEGRQDAPVGTTLAMLEAAIKPTAAVFKRLHEAQGHELRMLADRFGRDRGAVYPYLVDGKRGQAIAADFADNTDVVPTSDPNIPTQTQRLAQAQGVLQMAMASNGIMDLRAAFEDMLKTMGRSPTEIERLMPKAPQGQPADVATEFANALKGMPLAVGPQQDHYAHALAHIPILSMEGLPPNVTSAMMAHVGEHIAAWYRQQAELACMQMGVMLPPPGQPMPPAIEAAMARAVAQVSDTIVTKMGGMLGAGAGDPTKLAELAYKREELAFKHADSERKSQETARQDQTELLKLRQEAIDAAADRALEEAKLKVKVGETLTKTLQAHHQGEADRQEAQRAQNRDHLHDWHMTQAQQQHAEAIGAAERQHAAQTGTADRAHKETLAAQDRESKTGIALLGHVAGAHQQNRDHQHQAGEAERGRQHEATQAEQQRQYDAKQARNDRAHQTGIAAGSTAAELKKAKLAADSGLQKAKLTADAALTRQKVAGETTLKVAKMKPKPKPTAKPAKKAAK